LRKETLGSRIRGLRESLGMTQTDLATSLDLTQAAVSQLESDRHLPSYETLVALADVLCTSTDYLTGRDL